MDSIKAEIVTFQYPSDGFWISVSHEEFVCCLFFVTATEYNKLL